MAGGAVDVPATRVQEQGHTAGIPAPFLQDGCTVHLHVDEHGMLGDVLLDLVHHRFGGIALCLWLKILVGVGAEENPSSCTSWEWRAGLVQTGPSRQQQDGDAGTATLGILVYLCKTHILGAASGLLGGHERTGPGS